LAFKRNLLLALLDPQTVNGKIRAKQLAKVAVDTLLRFYRGRRMIPLGIEFIRKFQNIFGAVFDTETAPLASFFYDMKFTPWDFNLVNI
jgi:hypothetical protein